MLTLLRTEAAQRKVLLLAPSSEQVTWDAIADGTFGKDAASVQHAMATVFDHFSVDRDRIAVAGFASYALGLGLTNGDLFTRVLPTPPAASRRAAATAA
jgi:predicted esterase